MIKSYIKITLLFIVVSVNAGYRRRSKRAIAPVVESTAPIPQKSNYTVDVHNATLLPENYTAVSRPTPQNFIQDAVQPSQLSSIKPDRKTVIPIVYPRLATQDNDNKIEINLEKADLFNLLKWYSDLFKIDMLSADNLNPAPAGKVQGNTISFHTHTPLTKRQAWDLLLNFMNLLGLSLVATKYDQDHYPVSFNVMNAKDANKAALPSFVGTPWQELPHTDTRIRYVYFVENGTSANLAGIVKELVSNNAALIAYAPLNALIFTDKSSTIRSIMAVISELDSTSVPEAMSVIRLRHANAEEVANLYNALVSTEQEGKSGTAIARILGQKRQATTVYFPPNTRVVPEKRTNSLIILGTKEGITKVENFVLNHVDTSLKQSYSPLYVYELQYANAIDMATMLTNVTQFANASAAAQFGGVRDGDKFLRPMTFVGEPSGNRLLIKAAKEDYLAVRPLIQELDVLQPQVNIEVLIVNVTNDVRKELGVQLRNKSKNTLGKSIDFQTSGIRNDNSGPTGIITDANGGLMGNLISLAQGQGPGATLLSIGSNIVGGVWGLFKILDTYVHSNVVSHPFLTSTNKYTAQVSLGEKRRVSTGRVKSTGPDVDTQGDVSANLSVKITPQINHQGMINLDIEINIDDFVSADPSSANKNTKSIKTNTVVANKQIVAIGGLIVTNYTDITSKVPLIGNIPLIGNLFKDKFQEKTKSNLVVFMSAEVTLPGKKDGMGNLTQQRLAFAKAGMNELTHPSEPRDPIYRWYFDNHTQQSLDITDNYINNTIEQPCEDIYENNCERVIEFVPNKGIVTSNGPLVAAHRKPSLTDFINEVKA